MTKSELFETINELLEEYCIQDEVLAHEIVKVVSDNFEVEDDE